MRSMEVLFVFSLIFMRLRKDLPYSDESEMHKRSLRVSKPYVKRQLVKV